MDKLQMLVAAIAAGPILALAHHGWSEYDAGKTLKLTGQVTEVGYDNPHAFVKLKTADKTWVAILAPPSRLDARGLPKGALKVGNAATVEGYPSKSKAEEMRAERLIVGGKVVELR
ncbi:MAG: hypothetical protein H0T80_19015 [Betaproteobacteria bacterium]|nr:hypothetical protein [Betaproteobacteria bacterium]MBA3776082.1 hypothetical protein [Betaproteobacteria bacterium]